MSLEALMTLNPDIKVRPSEEFAFSRDAPVEFFDSDNLNAVNFAFSNLYDYLGLPYVIDVFGNHEERRAFKGGLSGSTLEIYENNALRTGRVNNVDLSLQILSRVYIDKSDSNFFDKITEIRNYATSNFRTDYDPLKPIDKVYRALKLKEKIVSLLHYLEIKKDTS